MRDEALIEHLPKMHLHGGRVLYDNGWKAHPVWQIQTYDTRHLSPAELNSIARARTTAAPVFLTPKSGRVGWNVRKTFPAFCLRKRIPFLVVFGGEVVRLSPTNENVMVQP